MKSDNALTENKSDDLNKPPLFRTWGHWYLLLFLFLLAQIFFFLYLTRHFA